MDKIINTMSTKPNFKMKSAFINRQKELSYLYEWINQEPNHILFVYGPKSSGKTTLLIQFVKKYLDNKHYDLKHFNLREMLIVNYSDFIQTFFEVDFSKSKEDSKRKREYNLKLFKLSEEIIKSIEYKKLDPFVVMKKELWKIIEKGKRPIIIIDEVQALDNIYMNGQRELLKELFNFFVSITKESHLCHVVIASSDGYFMNRLYDDSKLSKTSKFLEIEYFDEQTTKTWLSNLEKENSITSFTLTNTQIDTIWKYFGGSIWEIVSVLGDLINFAENNKIKNKDLKNVIQTMIVLNKGKFLNYSILNENKTLLLKELYKICNGSDYFDASSLKGLISKNFYEESGLKDELTNLVKLNILAFNPTTSLFKLQGNSMYYGLKEYTESLSSDFL